MKVKFIPDRYIRLWNGRRVNKGTIIQITNQEYKTLTKEFWEIIESDEDPHEQRNNPETPLETFQEIQDLSPDEDSAEE